MLINWFNLFLYFLSSLQPLQISLKNWLFMHYCAKYTQTMLLTWKIIWVNSFQWLLSLKATNNFYCFVFHIHNTKLLETLQIRPSWCHRFKQNKLVWIGCSPACLLWTCWERYIIKPDRQNQAFFMLTC